MSSSCLTVFGLASDATEREVHVLFSGCPGYVRNVVVPGKNSQKPYAFVQFGRPEEALAASEARKHTSWSIGALPIVIELAKRDIPESFTARQDRSAAAATIPHLLGPPRISTEYQLWNGPEVFFDASFRAEKEEFEPPPALSRQPLEDEFAYLPPPPPPRELPRAKDKDKDREREKEKTIAPGGPQTLHITGLPPGIQQKDLDTFVRNTFRRGCTGSKLDATFARAPRAFLGFKTHKIAEKARHDINGLEWEGHVLRADWARSEYRPPQNHAATPTTTGGSSVGGATGDADDSATRCTLQFRNLPTDYSESQFNQFLRDMFGNQVVCSNFKGDAADGRPPIAWVLFENEQVAADVVANYESFRLAGAKVTVRYSRSEMVPRKILGEA